MRLWKRLLLPLYIEATRPWRANFYWNAVQAGRLPMAVLFYHRVADDCANPWTLSNRMFARQLDWLQRNFELISLEEVQRRIRRGVNDRPAVSITFDDGYGDNCRAAIPLLVERQVPCTYFVTLRNVMNATPFAHDVALGRALRPNTLDEIRAMASAGIEIGAHTFSHCDLGAITDAAEIEREVVDAGRQLSRLVERPVRYFAFPYGRHENLSRAAFDAAEHAGYLGACSAYGGYNTPGGDAFHLQRIGVNNDLIGLKNWLTFDPRKRNIPRYEYLPFGEATADDSPKIGADGQTASKTSPLEGVL